MAYISPFYNPFIQLIIALVAAHFATKGVEGREKRIALILVLALVLCYHLICTLGRYNNKNVNLCKIVRPIMYILIDQIVSTETVLFR